MVIINQKVNRILYIICIATAVFCRTPPSENTKTVTEKEEKKKAGIRMMILIVFIILCALVFICKKFSKSSQQQEIEVVRSVSREGSPEPAVIPLNTPFEDKDHKKRSLQCNTKPNHHQTSTYWNSIWKESSAIDTKPLTPTMLELDTKSLQPQQDEQHITKPSTEALNSRMSTAPVPATTLDLERRSLRPQQAEQQLSQVTQPLSHSSRFVASLHSGVMTRPALEQVTSSLQPLEDVKPGTRAIEIIRTPPYSIEALNSRITRKQLLGKAVDVMKIGWTSKQTSRISVHVV